MNIFPETQVDNYKIFHRLLYPKQTEVIFTNFTPRKSYRKIVPDGVVFFGLQYFIKEYLIKQWNENFFKKPKEEVVSRFVRRIKSFTGHETVDASHIAELHDLGFLPLQIMALPEGSIVPYKVAPLVIWNTIPEFFWLTNYLETIMSATVWPLLTTATTAKQFRDLGDKYAAETGGDLSFVKWMGHNFSYRGCMGHEAAVMVDAGWMTSFSGSDTLPGIDFMEEYYNANSDNELVSGSVVALEHSTICAYGVENEFDALQDIIFNRFPTGIISFIADSYDYWGFITEYLPRLKDGILNRNGKLVVRPDSGDNVKVIIGDKDAPEGSPERKGTIELLWDIFGGTVNEKGYKVLHPTIGAILGDGVSLDVFRNICEGLKEKGFASTNMVYGCGSYSLQFSVSRDTDGTAAKSTYCVVAGEPRNIFKDPKTDKNGLKKSAKGLIAVYKDENGKFFQKEEVTWDETLNCEYRTVFNGGRLIADYSLSEIRNRIHVNF